MDADSLCKLINDHVAGYQCLFEKDGQEVPGFQTIQKAFPLAQEDYRPELIDPMEWTSTTVILASMMGHGINPPQGWIVDAAMILDAEPINDGISMWSAKHTLRIHKVISLKEKDAQ